MIMCLNSKYNYKYNIIIILVLVCLALQKPLTPPLFLLKKSIFEEINRAA